MSALRSLFKTPGKCHRPWTYRWWPGNSIHPNEIGEHLDQMISHGIGGAVIADRWPGAWDEYGRPQTVLTPVFGVHAAAKKTAGG